MADFDLRLKMAGALCAIFAIVMIVAGVLILLTLSGTIDFQFLKDLLSAEGKLDTSSISIIILFGSAPIVIGLCMMYCSILCYTRTNYYVGLVILIAGTLLTFMPVLNLPGTIIFPCIGIFVIWLFASCHYEFY